MAVIISPQQSDPRNYFRSVLARFNAFPHVVRTSGPQTPRMAVRETLLDWMRISFVQFKVSPPSSGSRTPDNIQRDVTATIRCLDLPPELESPCRHDSDVAQKIDLTRRPRDVTSPREASS